MSEKFAELAAAVERARRSGDLVEAMALMLEAQADLITRLCLHGGLADPSAVESALIRPRPVLKVIEGGHGDDAA